MFRICVIAVALAMFATHACGAPLVACFERFCRSEDADAAGGGELLLTELSCTACHRSEQKLLAPKSGPNLSGVGNRLQFDWLNP